MRKMELIFLVWVPMCIAVAILANRYNRSGFAWLVFSLLLSPLLGFAFVLALGPLLVRQTMAQSREAVPSQEEIVSAYRDATEKMKARAATRDF